MKRRDLSKPQIPLARFYTRNRGYGKGATYEVVDRDSGQVLSRWNSATAAFAERERLEAATGKTSRS